MYGFAKREQQPLEEFIRDCVGYLNSEIVRIAEDTRVTADYILRLLCYDLFYVLFYVLYLSDCLYAYLKLLFLMRRKRKRKLQRRTFVSSAKNSLLKGSSLNWTTILLLLTIKEEKHHVYKGAITICSSSISASISERL
jgi:hypothetical protein